MMNGLWAGMMLAAVVYGAFYGTLPDITQAALDSAKEDVYKRQEDGDSYTTVQVFDGIVGSRLIFPDGRIDEDVYKRQVQGKRSLSLP